MAGINEDRERQVVPLWRAFDATNVRGELAPLVNAPEGRFSDSMLSALLLDWEEAGGLSVACDLVSVALTLGRFKVAGDAARFILEHPNATPAARGVAELYLSEGKTPAGVSAVMATSPAGGPGIGVGLDSLSHQLHFGVRKVRLQLNEHFRTRSSG